jgi:hypothetical protein
VAEEGEMKLYSEMTQDEQIRYCAESAEVYRKVRGSVECTLLDGPIKAVATADGVTVWVDGVEVSS